MQRYITIALTPEQAGIVHLALQEYQQDFEAALNVTDISDVESVNDVTMYAIVTEECNLVKKSIEIQLGINL